MPAHWFFTGSFIHSPSSCASRARCTLLPVWAWLVLLCKTGVCPYGAERQPTAAECGDRCYWRGRPRKSKPGHLPQPGGGFEGLGRGQLDGLTLAGSSPSTLWPGAELESCPVCARCGQGPGCWGQVAMEEGELGVPENPGSLKM